jgi:hypothetical protein
MKAARSSQGCLDKPRQLVFTAFEANLPNDAMVLTRWGNNPSKQPVLHQVAVVGPGTPSGCSWA